MTTFDHPMFGWERDHEGIVLVTMDDTDQSANTMNTRFQAELPMLVDHLYAERDSLTGVIITSAKDTFFAGGDLGLMMNATSEDVPQVRAMIEGVKAALRRLELLGKPVVAAINGAALGGGYEIALACHHRIALNDRTAVVGLPEVTLGLLPGGGGTVRTVRMFGVQAALQDILLSGKRYQPAEALAKGLVDGLVERPEDLVDAARRSILTGPDPSQPWDRKGFRIPGGAPGSPQLASVLGALPALLRRQSHGAPAQAARAVLASAVEGAQVDFEGAQLIESRYITDLICGQPSTNIIRSTFFDLRAVNGGASRPEGYPPFRGTKVVVLGAGMMGAGIGYICAKAGMQVVLKDVDLEAAERGKAYSAKLLGKAVAAGRVTPEQRAETLGRILATADPADAAGADLLIEAVFENPDLKRSAIGETLPYLAPDALIASNTSTLPITGLADGVPAPENFLGMHFFSPVDKMALLEIVVGAKTSDATLARAVDVAVQIGKSPIVVNDSRGFFTSRVIMKFINEALAMVGEGVSPVSVERAATQAGYPVGALTLIDELTLVLARNIRDETIEAAIADGGPAPEHPGAAVVDRMIDDFGRKGRSTGAGFYEYAEGRRTGLWSGLSAFGGDVRIPFADMQERMLFAEALDSVRCLDEHVLRSVTDANVGSILGIGFPAWTGGVLQYINQYAGGPAGFVARARELAERYGDRFTPPESLVRKAEAGTVYA